MKTALTIKTIAALLLLAALTPLAHAAQQDFQSGALLLKITTTSDPRQSYALYLPSSYTASKHWPIVYAFDPGARGARPSVSSKRLPKSTTTSSPLQQYAQRLWPG